MIFISKFIRPQKYCKPYFNNLYYEISERNYPVLYFLQDAGDEVLLYEGNSLVHIAMRKKEIPMSTVYAKVATH